MEMVENVNICVFKRLWLIKQKEQCIVSLWYSKPMKLMILLLKVQKYIENSFKDYVEKGLCIRSFSSIEEIGSLCSYVTIQYKWGFGWWERWD